MMGSGGWGGTIYRTSLPQDRRQDKGQDGLASPIVPADDTAPPAGGTLSPFQFRRRPYAASAWFVQRNSVPSTHMRCMTTAIRRAKATIALFIPRCRATFMPQAFSHDHLVVRVNMTWAASNSIVRSMASPHYGAAIAMAERTC